MVLKNIAGLLREETLPAAGSLARCCRRSEHPENSTPAGKCEYVVLRSIWLRVVAYGFSCGQGKGQGIAYCCKWGFPGFCCFPDPNRCLPLPTAYQKKTTKFCIDFITTLFYRTQTVAYGCLPCIQKKIHPTKQHCLPLPTVYSKKNDQTRWQPLPTVYPKK